MHKDVSPWRWDFVISNSWHRCEKSTGTGILGSGGDTAEMLVPAVRFTHLMQFTGLHDKNGKEIYEGDIIAVEGEDKPMKITWGERQATFCIESEAWVFPHYFGEALESKDCVVIGNIYETPELLTP